MFCNAFFKKKCSGFESRNPKLSDLFLQIKHMYRIRVHSVRFDIAAHMYNGGIRATYKDNIYYVTT